MVVIVLLYVASVPWYRDSSAPLRLWLGLPDWVAVALLCYVGVALVNAVAWSVAEIPDVFQEVPKGTVLVTWGDLVHLQTKTKK